METGLAGIPQGFPKNQNDRTDMGNTWGTLPGPKDHSFLMIFMIFQ